MIPDNTKAIVNQADPLDAKLVLGFVDYAQSRGFVVDPTRVRSPKDKARVERAVQAVADDCFGGERLASLEDAREHARRWGLEEYGRRRHRTTQRMPLEHFQAEERAALLRAPETPYDIPVWPAEGGSRPACSGGEGAVLAAAPVPRQAAGGACPQEPGALLPRARTGEDTPAESAWLALDRRQRLSRREGAYAQRDVAFLARKANEHGEAVGRFAEALLAGPLPWTRMRRAYALLGLVRRYGSTRVEQACTVALEADMVDVYRLRSLLETAGPAPAPTAPARVIPLARYLRPAQQYAPPLVRADKAERGEKA